MLLLYYGGITAAFAEPDYRYHHFVLLIRILTAGFGIIALLRILPEKPGAKWTSSIPWRDTQALMGYLCHGIRRLLSYDLIDFWLQKRPRSTAFVALALSAIVFGGWAAFMLRFTT
jgi:hypothetical protein